MPRHFGKRAGPERARAEMMLGKVSAFDDHRGLGEIAAEDGSIYPFHCTEITDGTRTIAVGTEVEFAVVPGHLGRWEAAAVSPAGATA